MELNLDLLCFHDSAHSLPNMWFMDTHSYEYIFCGRFSFEGFLQNTMSLGGELSESLSALHLGHAT